MKYKTQITVFIMFVLINLFSIGAGLTKGVMAAEVMTTFHVPNRLVIPSIGLDSEVVSIGLAIIQVDGQTYGQWLVDDNLIGWHDQSAPLGQIGNTVLNGHSDRGGVIFQNLHLVAPGDTITIFANDQVYDYTITETTLVQEKGVSLEQRIQNAQLIMPTKDERLTLITCANPEATHRLIVTAYPIVQDDSLTE